MAKKRKMSLQQWTDLFERLGADYPEIWAERELEGEAAELGRFVALRCLWDKVLAYPESQRGMAIEMARDFCYLLDGRPHLIPPELEHLNWGLFLVNEAGKPRKPLSGMVGSFDEVRPEGLIWGKATNVLRLREAEDADLPRVLDGLDQLTALWLGGTNVTDAGVTTLLNHPTLTVLDLSSTKVTDACVATVTQLPNLQALYLQETAITDQGVQQLSAIPGLNSLSLVATAVTDAGVAHLLGCDQLQSVMLPAGNVSEATLAALREKFPRASIRAA